MRLRILQVLLCIGGALGLGVAAIIILHSWRIKSDATAFLIDVEKLRPGVATFEDLLNVKHKYAKYARLDGVECNSHDCTIDFYFYNMWMNRIHAAPVTRFGGGVTARDGRVQKIDLALVANYGQNTMADISAQVIDNVDILPMPYYTIGEKLSGGTSMAIRVQLSPTAHEDFRKNAYAFNLACLSKLNGCADSHQMLPLVGKAD